MKRSLETAIQKDLNLQHFSTFLNKAKPVLLIKEIKRELQLKGVPIKKASRWLQALEA